MERDNAFSRPILFDMPPTRTVIGAVSWACNMRLMSNIFLPVVVWIDK